MSEDPHRIKSHEPHDDGWHYLDSRDEKHTGNYIEWKYFNFTGENLTGYIIYYIVDPEKRTKFGGGRLLVRIFKDGTSHGFVKKVEMDEIDIDALSATMRMGDAELIEQGPYQYQIKGKSPDLDWDLNYAQHAPTVESFQNMRTSFVRWEKVNWLVKMPRAKVTGNIRIGKENFQIDALGYSDTNWGEMVPFFTKYEWGQFNSEHFSLVFGILNSFSKIDHSYFYFILGEHLVALEDASCEVHHDGWTLDKDIGVKIPTENTFYVKNDEYEIKFSTKLISHDSPGLKISSFLPKIVVSEQIVEYNGVILRQGKVLHEFRGKGFEEWTTKSWKNISLLF